MATEIFKWCEECCNFDSVHLGTAGCSTCSIVNQLVYGQSDASKCPFFNKTEKEALSEIMRAARSCINESCSSCSLNDGSEHCISKLLSGLLAMQSLKQENSWISTSKRLPDDEFDEYQKNFPNRKFPVLVVVKNCNIPTLLFYDKKREMFYDYDVSSGLVLYPVEYWQSLPGMPEDFSEVSEILQKSP